MKYILIILILSGCGANHYLRKAKSNIAKAIERGADVKADTVFQVVEFTAPRLSFETTLTNPNWQDTLILRGKDSIQVKIFRVPATLTKPEIVYVAADCPEQTVEKEIPIGINQEISSGYSLWDMIITAVAFAVIGYVGRIVYMMFKVSIRNQTLV